MTYTSPTGKTYADAREIAADLARHPGETWPIPAPLRLQAPDLPRLVDGVWTTPPDGLSVADDVMRYPKESP